MSSTSPKEELSSKLSTYFNLKLAQLQKKFEEDISLLETLKFSYYDTCISELLLLTNPPEPIDELPTMELQTVQTEPSINPTRASLTAFNSKKNLKKETPATRSKTPLRPNDKKHGDKSVDKSKPSKKPSTNIIKTADKPKHSKGQFNVAHKDNSNANTTTANSVKDSSKDLSNNKKLVNKKKPLRTSISNNNTKDKKDGKKPPINHNKKENSSKNEHDDNQSETTTPLPSAETKTDTVKDQNDDVVNSDFKEITLKNNINNVTITPKIRVPKFLVSIPDCIKDNKTISCLYMMLQSKFLNLKNKYKLISSIPRLFKEVYGTKLNFLLEEKINQLNHTVEEIESKFKKYDEINTYLTKNFVPSKPALNSLAFITKEVETTLIKKDDLPNEIRMLIEIVYNIIDEKYDEATPTNKLVENLVNEIFLKFEAKDIKNVITNYVNHNPFLNATLEKYNKINNYIKTNPKIMSSKDIPHQFRPVSYLTFFIKDVIDYMGLKTTDGVYYFELRRENSLMKDYRNIIERYKQLISEH